MEQLESEHLAEIASLLVTLMIFFSIDAKFRFRRKKTVAKEVFRTASISGGVLTVVSLAIVWVEMFLPEKTMPALLYFVPASLAILAALVLAVEVVLLRKGSEPEEEGDTDEDPHNGENSDEDAESNTSESQPRESET